MLYVTLATFFWGVAAASLVFLVMCETRVKRSKSKLYALVIVTALVATLIATGQYDKFRVSCRQFEHRKFK